MTIFESAPGAGYTITIGEKTIKLNRAQAQQLAEEMAEHCIMAECPSKARCDLSYDASIQLMIERDELVRRLK